MSSHNWIDMTHFWQEYQKDDMPFSIHDIDGCIMPMKLTDSWVVIHIFIFLIYFLYIAVINMCKKAGGNKWKFGAGAVIKLFINL